MNRSRQANSSLNVTSNPTQPHVQRWVVEREDEYARTWVDLDSLERRIEVLIEPPIESPPEPNLDYDSAFSPADLVGACVDPITHDTALAFYLSAMAFAMSLAALFISIVT